MDFDSTVDPRYGPLPPTDKEIEAWAEREHQRRQAWLAGPTEEEKEAWALRFRRRAALGLAESRLAPSREEMDQWARREHERRQAWLAGPTEQEKQEWARRAGRPSFTGFGPDLPPTAGEVEEWAGRERQRRQEWLAGPSEDEKHRWARGEAGGLWEALTMPPAIDTELFDMARRLFRDADLVGKGSLFALSRAPLAIWSYLMRSGRAFEEEFYRQPSRTRVRF